jgi:SAM-dependent methyltransferase
MPDLLKLRDKLKACDLADDSCRYIAQMWNYTLEMHERQTSCADEFCDAIPYVPFEPESYGLDLGKDSTVLDLGCLGGYGLYDFAHHRIESGSQLPDLIGVDRNIRSVEMGRDLAECWGDCANVTFKQMDSAYLGFAPESIDLVVARLLLPYVSVSKTLSEIARVLKNKGIVLFQIHSFKYYRDFCLSSIADPGRCLYYARALLSGMAFVITHHQPQHRWFREIAMGRSTLIKLCRKHGMVPIWEGGFRRKPMVAFRISKT